MPLDVCDRDRAHRAEYARDVPGSASTSPSGRVSTLLMSMYTPPVM